MRQKRIFKLINSIKLPGGTTHIDKKVMKQFLEDMDEFSDYKKFMIDDRIELFKSIFDKDGICLSESQVEEIELEIFNDLEPQWKEKCLEFGLDEEMHISICLQALKQFKSSIHV